MNSGQFVERAKRADTLAGCFELVQWQELQDAPRVLVTGKGAAVDDVPQHIGTHWLALQKHAKNC
eukprot:5166181-Pyramimonas_sp.AAC.1